MSITTKELAVDLAKYLLLAQSEDIFIMQDGQVIAKLTSPHQDRIETAKSLFGVLPADITLEEARDERLGKI